MALLTFNSSSHSDIFLSNFWNGKRNMIREVLYTILNHIVTLYLSSDKHDSVVRCRNSSTKRFTCKQTNSDDCWIFLSFIEPTTFPSKLHARKSYRCFTWVFPGTLNLADSACRLQTTCLSMYTTGVFTSLRSHIIHWWMGWIRDFYSFQIENVKPYSPVSFYAQTEELVDLALPWIQDV